MQTFTQFLEDASEETQNIRATLNKLPRRHSALVDGYRFTLKGGNTLPGDNNHVGYMDKRPKEICVAAPWRYSREFTTLHEIAHLVFEKLLSPKLKAAWSNLVKKNPSRNQDNDEENFAMAYAAVYADHPPLTHLHPQWINFIKNKVPK